MPPRSPSTPCPDECLLVDLVQGLLEGAEFEAVEGHLDVCAPCRRVVVVLASGGRDAPRQAALEERLTPGSKVGRYVLLEHVGLGGMGRVYAAHDPELDRKVALKLLRADLDSGGDADMARARLGREAQALARLSHPNVVSVHDVGAHGGSIFIAMDFVVGTTLRRWMRASSRPWSEVVACFLQAGRGLAAAHVSGLVHRDFKPENVLVGADGRVRVTDFGLARLAREVEPAAPGASTGTWRAQAVTQRGALLGTVAYMSPEQLDGRTADARSDQFSFCVALYEALHGQRPFTGSTPEELRRAMQERPAPLHRRLPSRIRRALRKGLATLPEARHASMEALLSALEHEPGWARWRRLGVGIGVATALGAVSGFWLRENTRCAGLEQRLVGTWDADRKHRLEGVFRASGLRQAEQAWQLTAKRLEAYALSLLEMERGSCEATRLRAEQSEQMLDLRSACLSRRWGALRAAGDLMLLADPGVLERAPESANALPDIQPCADRSALASVVPLPESPRARERLEGLHALLAEATAYHTAGRDEAALALARRVLEGVREVDHPPDEAATHLLLGYVEGALGRYDASWESFREAQRAALAGRDDELLVRALTGLIHAEVQGRARYDEAEYAARLAEAVLGRMDAALATGTASDFRLARGHLRALQDDHEGALADYRAALALRKAALGEAHPQLAEPLTRMGIELNHRGRYEEALAHNEQALRLREQADGPQSTTLIELLNNGATSLRLLGRVEEAVARYARALELAERSWPDEHPSTLMVRVNLGDALQRQGKLREALSHYERALPGLRRIHGEAHPRVTAVLTSLGNAHADLGQLALAERAYSEALALQLRHLGAEHPDLALTYNNLGTVKLDARDFKEARRLLLLARGLWEKALGTEHPKVASVIQNLAKADLEEGRLSAALQGFQHALELRRKALGREHPKVVVSLTLTGEATRRLRGGRAALGLLEEAVALAGKVEVTPFEKGAALFALARALWDAGGERQRAVGLARQAGQAFLREARGAERECRELREWLARRGLDEPG